MSINSNRLPILQAEIRAAHEAAIAAAQTAVDRARDAGTRLIEAKSLLNSHGLWLPWLKETGVSPRTAQDYMRLARLTEDKYATVAHLGIRKALAEIANSRTGNSRPDPEIERLVAAYSNWPRHIQDEFISSVGAVRIVDPVERIKALLDGLSAQGLETFKEWFWGTEVPARNS